VIFVEKVTPKVLTLGGISYLAARLIRGDLLNHCRFRRGFVALLLHGHDHAYFSGGRGLAAGGYKQAQKQRK
jgi:hypothetical protein